MNFFKILIISFLLFFNYSYALKNKFIDPRNNSNQIIDIGFEEPQGNAYLSKSWQEVLSEIRTSPNIREYTKRNYTREESCISDGTEEYTCPYNSVECPANFEYESGTSKEIKNISYASKVETEVDYTSGGKMQATYSLSPNCGSINGATWTAEVLRGNLSQNTSGQTLYDQGFKNSVNGKFAMKAFNFGSGCGGLTIRPLPDRITTLKNGGAAVELRDSGGCCLNTISSGNGQWATVYMEWDTIPDKISWVLDDYGYISTPDTPLGFVEKLCPTGYSDVNENPELCTEETVVGSNWENSGQCYAYNPSTDCLLGDTQRGVAEEDTSGCAAGTRKVKCYYAVNSCDSNADICSKTDIHYEYSCPDGLLGTEDEGYRYSSWTTPLDAATGSSPTPPTNNCKRSKYTCPVNSDIPCVQTSGLAEMKYKKIFDQGSAIKHDETIVDSKTENTIIETIDIETETKIEWADKLTVNKKLYSATDGPDGVMWYCDNGWTFNSSNNKCEKDAIGNLTTNLDVTFQAQYYSTPSASTDRMSVLSTTYGSTYSNQTIGSFSTMKTRYLQLMGIPVAAILDDDGLGNWLIYAYQNYTMTHTRWFTFKTTLTSAIMVYSCEDGSNPTADYKCQKAPSTSSSGSNTFIKCSNNGDPANGCMKCPVTSWNPPANCFTGCNTTITYQINPNGIGTQACVYEYETRECPVNRPNDHGTDIAGNTCTVSNQNVYDSHCDDCSKTTLTALCPADAEFPSETYPNLEDPDRWFLSGTQCQRTTFEYICSDPDFVIEDDICQKHYSWYQYTCPNEEWIGPAEPGTDCLGTCEGNNCICNSELPPEENCYQNIPIVTGEEPVKNLPATKFETNPAVTTNFNGSEYGLTKGYICVDENGENCGYDVWKVEGDGERLCFNDKLFHYECIDVQGCTFTGSIEIDKKQSFSALIVEPNDNRLYGFVKGSQVPGYVESSCIMNGQVGQKDTIGGFNAVKMQFARMSFWNSYTTPENMQDKSCIIGAYDKTTNTCLPAEGQDSYPAILAYKIKADQPTQTKQQYSYGTKVDFTADADGNAIVKVSANFIGYCPVGTLVGDKCRTSERAPLFYDEYTYTCATTGFSPGTDRYCEKDVSIKTSIADSDWFIKDLVVPQNGSTVSSNGLTFKIDGALLNVNPDTSVRSAYYANNYALERVYEYSCNPGDIQENETTCKSGELFEGENFIGKFIFFDENRLLVDNINIIFNETLRYAFSQNKNNLIGESSMTGSIKLRLLDGDVVLIGTISHPQYSIKGNGNQLEYYDIDDNLIGSHTFEFNGQNIQISGGRVVKDGVFDFTAPDGNLNLQDNEILVAYNQYQNIIQFVLESNKYCPDDMEEGYNTCYEKNKEMGFLEFVPSCAEVTAKDSEFFYEGFQERNLLYDFNSIIYYDGFTYARSNYQMTESECQAFVEEAGNGWQLATIDFDRCEEGWVEKEIAVEGSLTGETKIICEKINNADGYDIIEAIYNGDLNPADLFIPNSSNISLEFSKIRDAITGDRGIFVYASASNTHTEGFHFKPSFSYNGVEIEYKMQGTDNGYRCNHSNWVPLNGPGYNGGYNSYLSPCPDGFTCIQGSPTLSKDTPISVTYTNLDIDSSKTLLTWSGSNYNGDAMTPSVGGCARSTNISDDRAGTLITKFNVNGYDQVQQKELTTEAADNKEEFLNDYIQSGSYLDIYGSNGQPGTEPSDIYKTSCNGLLEEGTATTSGSYSIRIDDSTTINTYCDVSGSSGWTLAGKIDGTKTTWGYDNNIWTDTSLLNENDATLNKSEMKNKVWTSKSLTKIKLVFDTNGDQRSVIIPANANSLSELFNGSENRTISISRNTWKDLIPNSSLQLNCNNSAINGHKGVVKTRIGIISNQENDCNTPDSMIGIGLSHGNWGAGNHANGSYSPDNGNKDIQSFVYVYIMNESESFEREPGTNTAWCIIETSKNRSFENLDMCVKLNDIDQPIGFSCSPITCNNENQCQLARCEEGQDGMPDYLGTKQEYQYNFNGVCADQECDANIPHTEMCGRDTGCDLNRPGIIQKGGECFEQYCPEGDLQIEDPRAKCKVFQCPEGTIEQPDGRCLVPND